MNVSNLPTSKYQQIAELSNEGVWILDREGITTYVNPRMAHLLGHDAREMLGRSFLDYLVPDSPEFLLQPETESDYSLVKKDGSTLWLKVSPAPLFTDGTLYLISDLTESRRKQLAFEKTCHDLEKLVTERTLEIAKSRITFCTL